MVQDRNSIPDNTIYYNNPPNFPPVRYYKDTVGRPEDWLIQQNRGIVPSHDLGIFPHEEMADVTLAQKHNDIQRRLKNCEDLNRSLQVQLQKYKEIPIPKQAGISDTPIKPVEKNGGYSHTKDVVVIAGKKYKLYIKMVVERETKFLTVKQAEKKKQTKKK